MTPVGLTVNDPDVVLTDIGLAVLGGYLGWRLWRAPKRHTAQRAGGLIMLSLASAAFWGALFHALFPTGTTTLQGLLAWAPVVISIVVAASTMLRLALHLLVPQLPSWLVGTILLGYALSFGVVALLIDESYRSVVYFYVPVLLLLFSGASGCAIRGRSGWSLVAIGLLVSLTAAILQQFRVAIHPSYFDHNAVYHLVQATALILLYRGWRRAPADGYLRA
jgi:hypothetical protein